MYGKGGSEGDLGNPEDFLNIHKVHLCDVTQRRGINKLPNINMIIFQTV